MIKQLVLLIENNKLNLFGLVLATMALVALSYHHPVYALGLALLAIGSWTVRVNAITDSQEDSNTPDKDVINLLRKMEAVEQAFIKRYSAPVTTTLTVDSEVLKNTIDSYPEESGVTETISDHQVEKSPTKKSPRKSKKQ